MRGDEPKQEQAGILFDEGFDKLTGLREENRRKYEFSRRNNLHELSQVSRSYQHRFNNPDLINEYSAIQSIIFRASERKSE